MAGQYAVEQAVRARGSERGSFTQCQASACLVAYNTGLCAMLLLTVVNKTLHFKAKV